MPPFLYKVELRKLSDWPYRETRSHMATAAPTDPSAPDPILDRYRDGGRTVCSESSVVLSALRHWLDLAYGR